MGGPRKYGNKIKLYDLFEDLSKFTETTMTLYGKETKVKYLCLDLIWMPVKKLVRFVLVESNKSCCILMSSDLTLDPEDIITMYTLRFKIETSFAEQKHDIGCFDYHFWTTALPKKKKWNAVETPTDEKLMKRVTDTENAMDAFVCLSTVATGILSIIAFSHSSEIWNRYSGWLRTLRSKIPTVAIVKSTISWNFSAFLCYFPFISKLRRKSEFLYQDAA